MKLHFEPNLDYQIQAVEAVCDLFRGQELMVLGRYTGGGPATVTLRGTLGGVERTHGVTAELPKDARAEHGFVAALWAGRRLGALLRKVRLHGEDEASVAEIVHWVNGAIGAG